MKKLNKENRNFKDLKNRILFKKSNTNYYKTKHKRNGVIAMKYCKNNCNK